MCKSLLYDTLQRRSENEVLCTNKYEYFKDSADIITLT